MAAATERIPVLVTRSEKARIAAKAKKARMSMGEYLRRAAAAFDPSSEDERILEGMIEQVLKTTAVANAAIDDALAHVEKSNARIAALEAGRRKPGRPNRKAS